MKTVHNIFHVQLGYSRNAVDTSIFINSPKCKVRQYAGRLLYSMLQELSAFYSYFEIQKQKWTYAVTCRADCIRLLAGRGMNICHEV